VYLVYDFIINIRPDIFSVIGTLTQLSCEDCVKGEAEVIKRTKNNEMLFRVERKLGDIHRGVQGSVFIFRVAK